MAGGRGDALRHLGWLRLADRVAAELSTDLARERVFAELEAIQALLVGRSPEDIAREEGAEVAAALEREPSLWPHGDLESARARLDELEGFARLSTIELEAAEGLPQLAAAFGQLEDLEESLTVVSGGGTLALVELIGVAELCRACALIGALLRAAKAQVDAQPDDPAAARGLRALSERLRSVGATIKANSEPNSDASGQRILAEQPGLLERLDRSVDRRGEEPSVAADASPALAEARRELRSARQGRQTAAERMLRGSLAESLRDRYWTERDGRLVFPIRSDALGSVRSRGAIIHGSSSTGHTFYVEPASLVEANNAVREAELTVAEEERKVLRALSAEVAGVAEVLRGMQRACVALDLIGARWRFGHSLEAVIPELRGTSDDAPGPAIELRGARHPLLLIDGVDVVPNDIVLERGHTLIISGPNAGGKTVALETLGLMALMAAAGLALTCAGRPRLPVFEEIVTDIGDDQSIRANLSTFSAHVSHVLEALRAAERSAETLVLLDEIAVGTDPEQGAALAEAIVIELVERGATVVVTTHYDRLKLLATMPELGERVHNGAVGFDLSRMRPTFRLSLGVPGSSSAIAVARRLGMPEAVLARAEGLLGDEGVQVEALLREIEAERASLARTRERLTREQQRLRARDDEVRRREHRVISGVRSRRAKAYAAAAEQLHALEREIERRRKQLRRAEPERVDELPTRHELTGDARSVLAEHREREEAERARESRDQVLDPASLEVGQRVRVLSVGQEGEIVALRGRPPRRATVQLPKLRTTVEVGQLGPPAAKPGGRVKIKAGKAEPILDFQASVREQAEAHFGEGAVPVKAGFDNVCDLRGERYADAQDRVADFVAEAIARDQDVVVIRHGHGGGALRKAVREVLGRLGSVKRFRPGLAVEGGDAVTVAWVG